MDTRYSELFIIVLLLLIGFVGKANAQLYQDTLPVPFSEIVWDHTDVSGWPITAALPTVSIVGSVLHMPVDDSVCGWKTLDGKVNANVWVIAHRGGKWKANTWDFLRHTPFCQKSKLAEHIGAPDGWEPVAGEKLYIMVSGIARPGYAETIHERTNIVEYFWKESATQPLEQPPKDQVPVPLSQIIWEGSNPIPPDLPATRTMHEVWGDTNTHGQVCWRADITDWPSPDGHVNSNIFAIVLYEGKYYGFPWDYMGWKNIKPGTDNVYCKGQEHLGDYPKSQWPESLGNKPVQGEDIWHVATTIISNPSGAGFDHQRTNIVKCQWASGISCFPPKPCTGSEETPVIRSFTAEPVKVTLIPNNENNNLLLRWDTEFADNLRLETNHGDFVETNDYSPDVDGVWVRIEEDTTFMLTAINDCTPEDEWPSALVTVETQGLVPTGALSILLLNEYGNATTVPNE